MSNYELQSEVNRLERQLNEITAANNALRNEISAVVNAAARADQQLRDYNAFMQNTLDRCNGVMMSSTNKTIAAYELQGEIEKLYLRFKNVEMANKKIRACNNKRYYEFGNYRTVRKIVQGLMDNLDLNLVSDQAITKAIEVQHLQIPDYWLTCVLISVMAWKNDDKELADRAMARAFRLEKKFSSIFYMIINLRMARDEAALKWFAIYQNCDLKGSDIQTFMMLFSLVSKTIQDKINEEATQEIFRFINKIIMDSATAEGYSEDKIITTIYSYLNKLMSHDALEYPLLRKYCTEYSVLAQIMLSAKNNLNIHDFIMSIINVPIDQKNEYLKGYLDDLIALPNSTEKEVYDEIAYNELIIKYQGDIEAANNENSAEKERASGNLNLIAEMIDCIYKHDSNEINGQIKLNMFTLTKDLQEKAVVYHVENYRKINKNNLPIRIDDYSTQMDFYNETKEKQKLEDYYNSVKNSEFSKIKNTTSYVAFGISAAAVVCAFLLGYWILFLTIAGVGYGVYQLYSNNSKKNQIMYKCQDNIRIKSEIFHKICVEYSQFIDEYNGYDGVSDNIINELSKL